MSFYVNKQIILGNAGNDASAKVTPSGVHVTEVSIATSYGVKQKDGSYQNATTWHNCIAFNKPAEVLADVKKGDKVYIEGRTETQSWNDRHTGEKRYKNVVIVDNFVLIGAVEGATRSKESDDTGSNRERRPGKTARQEAEDFKKARDDDYDSFNEDIPF